VVLLCLVAFIGGGMLALLVGLLIPLRRDPVEPMGEPAMPEASLRPRSGLGRAATAGPALVGPS
jgi:hypothetical protein